MKNIIQALKVITLALVLSFGISYVYAWTAPTVTPPNGNVSAPINTSATAQYKDGAMGIGGLVRGYAGAIFDGNVGIGTTTPTASLQVSGTLKAGVSPQNISISTISNLPTIYGWNDTLNNHVPVSIRAQSGTQLYLDTTGNVGIGTTAPQVELHVKPSDGSHGDIAIESNDGFKWTMSSINSNGAWVLNRNIPGDLSAIIVGQNGVTQLAGLNIPANAGSGKVLTSDASGNATWQTGITATLPVVTEGATCTATATSNTGIKSDYSAILTCQSGSWKKGAGDSGGYMCADGTKVYSGDMYTLPGTQCYDPEFGNIIFFGGRSLGPAPTKPVQIDNSYGCGRLICPWPGHSYSISRTTCDRSTGTAIPASSLPISFGCSGGYITATW